MTAEEFAKLPLTTIPFPPFALAIITILRRFPGCIAVERTINGQTGSYVEGKPLKIDYERGSIIIFGIAQGFDSGGQVAPSTVLVRESDAFLG
jgi:hypothetical protein